jgi:hypothetical protein
MNESSHNVVPWQIRAEGVLPCAFCGGPPHFMPARGVSDNDFVTCSNPECFVRETSALPHRWNARPLPSTDEAARDWLIGRMEYIQLQGDVLIEAKDGEGYVVTLKPESEYEREILGAFDTLAEAVESVSATEAEQIADHCKANNITHHSINADGSCNMGCC